MADRVAEALAEVAEVLSGVDGDEVAAACRMIASAEAIGVYGCGREGFQMRGLAMRLFHLGRPVGYVGETTMPALGRGGLLVVSSGPGGLATVAAHMATARAARASVLLITAQPEAPNAGGADLVLTVPAQTMATDRRKRRGRHPADGLGLRGGAVLPVRMDRRRSQGDDRRDGRDDAGAAYQHGVRRRTFARAAPEAGSHVVMRR